LWLRADKSVSAKSITQMSVQMPTTSSAEVPRQAVRLQNHARDIGIGWRRRQIAATSSGSC